MISGKLIPMIFQLPTLMCSMHSIMYSLKALRTTLKSSAVHHHHPRLPPTCPSPLHSEYLFRSSNTDAPLTHLGAIILDWVVNIWALSLLNLTFSMANHKPRCWAQFSATHILPRLGEKLFFLILLKSFSFTPTLLEHLQSLFK